MQIITISRGSEILGGEFARKLAAKLDYLCIGREEILKEAKQRKISLEKLERAVFKPHLFSEQLALELDHYKALAASILCKKALKNNIVYHGRIGHILLPGVDHILKIRIIADIESRIKAVAQKLRLPKAEARKHIEQMDANMKKWVKLYYKVDCDKCSLYDIVINLSHISIDNAATAVCSMAQLPEFKATPAIIKSIQNLRLASEAQLLLAMNNRTRNMNIKIKASDNVLYVTYLAQQVQEAGVITEILAKLKDVREIICTEAETNILWIQEAFDPDDDSYNDVHSLAATWDAAVELLQILPSDRVEQFTQSEKTDNAKTKKFHQTSNIDNNLEIGSENLIGVSKTYEKLINSGHAGGKRIIQGSKRTLVDVIDRRIQYRLIILDNIFISKGHAAQIRLLQEWANFLSENLKIPVLSLTEIRSKYRFGLKEYIQMAFYALLTGLVIFTIFHFDKEILSFLSREKIEWKILSMLSVLVFIPLFAYSYSKVIRLLFKIIKFD
jgi:cytidylate kinase